MATGRTEATDGGARIAVIHANGEDVGSLETALRVARQAPAELAADVRIEIVVQGRLVTELVDGGRLEAELREATSASVAVLACRNSMARAGVEPDRLAEGIGTIPSAGAYLVTAQLGGAAYLRY